MKVDLYKTNHTMPKGVDVLMDRHLPMVEEPILVLFPLVSDVD